MRDKYQRIAYAMRRTSRAMDRLICASTPDEKARVRIWVHRWARVANWTATHQLPEIRNRSSR